jgi:hypothetical protein
MDRLFIYGSTVLLLDLGRFFSFLIHTQSVGLLGRGISPSQGRYLHTEEHKHRKKTHTDIHTLSGIRTYDPSVPAFEDTVIGALWNTPCLIYLLFEGY